MSIIKGLKNFFIENKFFTISIILYILLTFPIMLNHVPWYDEAHGWIVAQAMNFDNWLTIVRAEGHPLLWFLIIMPFAKFNIAYPYPMLFINYAACLAAIIIMWKKAPFNNILKVTITFSSMFIFYFPLVARGYSVGILLLFLIAHLYKKQLEKPVLYSLLISLTINLNIICAIAASWFGLVFLIRLLREQIDFRKKFLPAAIIIMSVLFFIFPFLGGFGSAASVSDSSVGFRNLFEFFKNPMFYYLITFLCAFIITFFKTIWSVEKTFYLYVLGIILILFKFFYPGYPHHFIFLFIYLLIFLWISNEVSPKDIEKPCYTKRFDLLNLFLILIFLFPIQPKISYIYHGNGVFNAKGLFKILNNDPQFRNCRLFLTEKFSIVVPYLKSDIETFDICTRNHVSWDTFYSGKCAEDIESFVDDRKNTYILTYYEIPKFKYYKWGNERIYFVPARGVIK